MSRLTELLCQEREPSSRVALRWDSSAWFQRRPERQTAPRSEPDSDRVVSWGEFTVDVARLRDHLSEHPTGGWVLLTDDAYVFAVGLFALWHSGRHAISPPNRQHGALRGPQTRAAGVLTDRPDWFSEGSVVDPLLSGRGGDWASAFSSAAQTFEAIDPDALAVEFFTSGTTGDEKPVLKQIRHLESEVEILGANWDESVAGATFFTSASHQHLYGMLFGVLWPLCSGHVFQAQHFLHAGELVPRLCAAPRSVLASVPTHLKRLAWQARSPALRGRCIETFSSGGALPAETAEQIEALVGQAPIEVYGSTETGGVAWRRQISASSSSGGFEGGSLWTPFESVEVEEDPESKTLRVRSPFVSAGSAASGCSDAFTTGDRVAIREGGRFELLGRVDRVVKIGERRLDLTRMESELRGQPWVDEVALTTLQTTPQREQDERGAAAAGERIDNQERVAAVVVPSERGWELMRRSGGRRALATALRTELAEAWDPVLHPRYWRFVETLPENAQGKITQTPLRALFQPADWGSLTADRPELLGETRFERAIERLALVPADLSCFPGHFEDRFVVPGVLQLDWAMAVAEVWLGSLPRVVEIESLKYLVLLEPGARFRIRVETLGGDRLAVKLWFGDEVFSKARLRIAEAIG